MAKRLAEIFSKNFFLFDKNEDDLLEYYNGQLFLKNKDSNFKGLDNKIFSGKIICVNKKGELKIRKTNNEEVNYSQNTIRFVL